MSSLAIGWVIKDLTADEIIKTIAAAGRKIDGIID
jgi:hypothetical protein